MFEVQVFSGIRFVITVLAIRHVANFRVFRFRDDASVADLRFFRLSTIAANCRVGLHGAFFQAAINVRRVISFVGLATRRFRVKGFASVQLRTNLRRVGKFQSIDVQDRFFAFNVLCLQRFEGGEGGIARRFRRTTGTRVLASAGTRCKRRASNSRSLASAFTRFVFYGEVLFRRFLRRVFVVLNDDFCRYFIRLRDLVRFFYQGVFSDQDPSFKFPQVFLRRRRIGRHVGTQANDC